MANKISGVYAITNSANGHRYIGSSANISDRWKHHVSRLDNGNHHSRHLQRAWKKYGRECFVFSVLRECREDLLIKIEQEYIDRIKPEYNISPTAGRTSGVNRSQEYREKQSASQKGKVIPQEVREKISAGMRGKKNSLGVRHETPQSVRDKIREKLLGHPVTEETKQKILANRKPYRHSEEAKQRIGAASKGNRYASRKQTPEEIEKRRQSLLAHYERKRNLAQNENC